ncbi:unnamed protein product [Sphenostylis stenocarpa]|uniref:Uncharacterized protein n=1 Tax=Sphenostylis stenocarpa TaxID=92480 RepID=A0AA86W3E4_9FABA|nr:unnamed protein product [Sphenostylis stenocarpa]
MNPPPLAQTWKYFHKAPFADILQSQFQHNRTCSSYGSPLKYCVVPRLKYPPWTVSCISLYASYIYLSLLWMEAVVDFYYEHELNLGGYMCMLGEINWQKYDCSYADFPLHVMKGGC